MSRLYSTFLVFSWAGLLSLGIWWGQASEKNKRFEDTNPYSYVQCLDKDGVLLQSQAASDWRYVDVTDTFYVSPDNKLFRARPGDMCLISRPGDRPLKYGF